MPGPLKNDDEAIPRPHVTEPDDERTPGDIADAESTTEANMELGELPGDGEVLPTPIEQEQDRETESESGGEMIAPTESPEDKADDIINGGIVHM
jgi:hypothetical protein